MTYEQKRDHIIAILTAEKEGEAIEYSPAFDMDWTQVSRLDWAHLAKHPDRYRIKPEPKLRPWRAEEVPLGAWYMHESGGAPWFADRIFPSGVMFAGVNTTFAYKQLLEQFRYSTDNRSTWSPCGVEE